MLKYIKDQIYNLINLSDGDIYENWILLVNGYFDNGNFGNFRNLDGNGAG